ncbi:type II toxin-antitoxin system HipA family toxin [Aeromicrobium phragmitis]|uniref:Type II toxin-antitoxin system HipA family toxin n=1 Tax=Aeromicrobium phragmitis TaxID=2478914 RepID=A0A3L8PLF1_9ACTN|nr:type II toxin-antitoxin system HipA family toxin [Aeromicrobium phragmitis]RLV56090.1 type II toxin-antitoxin system HipA family toxin [Aeromicrobium phragmitis]
MTRSFTVFTTLGGESVEAGTVNFTEGRTFTSSFRYAVDYLARPDSYPIEPGLPLDDAPHVVGGGLPLALDDASPDRWGRMLLERQRGTDRLDDPSLSPSLTPADYLVGVSDATRQGALRFTGEPEGPYLADLPAVPKVLELPRLLAAADAVTADDSDWAGAVKTLLDAGTGALGGAMPKAAVVEDGALWLAKFPVLGQSVDLAAWEKTALDLAAMSGVSVPERRILRLGERTALLVKRFDRAGEQRIPYISARTLIEEESETPHADYTDIVASLRAEGTRPDADSEALFRLVVLGALTNNTDNHLRNLGFLRSGTGWILAPAFDITPQRDLGQPRATSIAGSVYPGDTGRGLLALAPHCKLTENRARAITAEVLDVVSAWRDVAEENGAPGARIEVFAESFDTMAEIVRRDVLG